MFTWKPIYIELAKKLLPYRERCPELIKILSDAVSEGLNVIKLNDQNPKGNIIPLADIDPFTFFASFNRGGNDEGRRKILQFMKDRFSLDEPTPNDFAGIPVVNPQQSWFFAYAFERGQNDIETLWDMAEAAITQNVKEINSDLFAKCLHVKYVTSTNVTMGLFWLNPDTYVALDKKNRTLLKLLNIDSDVNDWNSYTELLRKVQSELGSDYADISHEAHLIATGAIKWEDSKLNPAGKKKHSLNTILYGPPGTGKTYSSFARAVEIIDGKLPKGGFGAIKARFDELVEKEQIKFITFHQSYSYEDFIEGIKPAECDNDARGHGYTYTDGIFKKVCELASDVKASGKGADVDLQKVQIWKMSLGDTRDPEDEHIYRECISGGFIAHGAGRGLNFDKFNSKDDIQKVLASLDWSSWSSTLNYHVSQIHMFKNKMQIGDLVIVSDGNQKFRAIGLVAGDYFYDADFVYEQKRAVTWLKVFEESQPKERILKDKAFVQLTLYQLSGESLKLDALHDLLNRDTPKVRENYVLIIDEINRGNISKILGELITLLEEDKRLGSKSPLKVVLPYTKKTFGVPNNLYILGTMNTADKSIALVDIALRRRFVFEELMPNFDLCEYLTSEMKDVLSELNHRIVLRKDRDHQIGHSYFMDVLDNKSFNNVFEKNIIPLLQEYFWNDWEGLRFVLGEESHDSGKFILPIPNSDMRLSRNKWQWFSDAKNPSFDYLEQLQKNYFPSTK